jgi:hypothetical protein
MSRRGRPPQNKICSVEGCGLPTKGAGFCNKHRSRWLNHGDPLKVIRERVMVRGLCKIEGCGKPHNAHGLCEMHIARVRRHGSTDTVRAPNGAGYTRPDGYRIVKNNGISQYEHIYLAEKALGRKLPEGAEVHHLNNNKADNHTPLNLVICPNAAYHMLLHKRARELGYEIRKPHKLSGRAAGIVNREVAVTWDCSTMERLWHDE